MDLTVVGAAADDQSATSGQHRPPVRALRVVMGPDPLACVHIPRLNFSKMVGAGSQGRSAARTAASPCEVAARFIGDRSTGQRATNVVVCRDVDHAGLWAEGDRRPVL